MLIRTVIVAATVVERLAPSERHASVTSSFNLAVIQPAPAPAKPAPRSWVTPSSLRHSPAYPPRRSSRARRPSSSWMTRLRILSTISRSWVTIRIVVPLRLMR